MKNQEFGLGIEAEGYFLNGVGEAIPRIEGKPTSEYVMDRFKDKLPQLVDNLSFELPSVVLEVKSRVQAAESLAVEEVMRIRNLVNAVLPGGIKLVFTPVVEKPYVFVPSTSDKNSRANKLIADWGKTTEGMRRLYASAICSLQINESRPFALCDSDEERLEVARKAHNLLSESYADMQKFNSAKKDFAGLTRTENYHKLMTEIKGPQFERRGYQPRDIVVPPFFADVEAMKRWMCAHSDVKDFAETRSKDEHGMTAKIKRGDFWAIETRIFDAVDSAAEMMARAKFNNERIATIM